MFPSISFRYPSKELITRTWLQNLHITGIIIEYGNKQLKPFQFYNVIYPATIQRYLVIATMTMVGLLVRFQAPMIHCHPMCKRFMFVLLYMNNVLIWYFLFYRQMQQFLNQLEHACVSKFSSSGRNILAKKMVPVLPIFVVGQKSSYTSSTWLKIVGGPKKLSLSTLVVLLTWTQGGINFIIVIHICRFPSIG